jgi:ankyrin repeat protein
MSATARQLNTFEVTAELLRVAESGDVDELLRLLPRVNDINARNRYGMTALMKAAFFGHEPVVRVLLERGADPNLMRTDRFTALALAAFFGHVDTVKTLIEFGARPEVVTRSGASARAWARARTFDEVARCLETHTPKPVNVVPMPASVPFEPVASAPPVAAALPAVKTLKEPPEIWDLVHEVPRNFNPRSAFVARIMSMKRTFALGACAAVLLIIGGTVGALMLRNTRARSVPVEIPRAAVAAEPTVSRSPEIETQAVAESSPVEVVSDNHARAVPNKARAPFRQPRVAPVVSEAPPENVQSREAPVVATPQVESPKPAAPAVKANPNTTLSPQLITPAKNAPPKGKVIQWP